ncbi:YoaK family protein [Leifsonia sp. fls2-241-R2A-40a]|uniref:YoaK family protein n=1 Tax=Leifsonia sp. fls2-241-R2A-40a TaxID=3040290 RepID=UPI00254E97AF|nr:YoaK family protein [Leifsonia sp. fls2-241-R2A-40a]
MDNRQREMTLVLMLALTFSTGIVDAVGYLGLDKVFAGNMTGNVVILGMALVGAEGLPWVGPLIALIAFMAGAVIGGRTLRRESTGWNTRTSWSFTAVAVALAVLTIVTTLAGGVPPKPWELVITTLLAASMGFQAAVARHLAVKDVTTVVVTSTITGLAADSVLAGGSGQPWRRRAAAVVLIALGALVGALLLRLNIAVPLGLATVVTGAAAVVGHAAAHEARVTQ